VLPICDVIVLQTPQRCNSESACHREEPGLWARAGYCGSGRGSGLRPEGRCPKAILTRWGRCITPTDLRLLSAASSMKGREVCDGLPWPRLGLSLRIALDLSNPGLLPMKQWLLVFAVLLSMGLLAACDSLTGEGDDGGGEGSAISVISEIGVA